MSDLYKHPDEYDREHLGDDEDIAFYLSLSRRLAPRKVLELGCGTGRITLPLAQLGFYVVGLDSRTSPHSGSRKIGWRTRHCFRQQSIQRDYCET